MRRTETARAAACLAASALAASPPEPLAPPLLFTLSLRAAACLLLVLGASAALQPGSAVRRRLKAAGCDVVAVVDADTVAHVGAAAGVAVALFCVAAAPSAAPVAALLPSAYAAAALVAAAVGACVRAQASATQRLRVLRELRYSGGFEASPRPFARHSIADLPRTPLAQLPLPLVESGATLPVVLETRPDATVLSCTVAGWPALAAARSPEDAALLLDDFWQRLDALGTKHGVFRAGTDAKAGRYLAVCGLMPARADHGLATLRAALEMLAVAGEVETGDGGVLSATLGLHCGPVAVAVATSATPALTIAGETVDIAMRLDATGSPGSVQMSAPAHAAAGCPYASAELAMTQMVSVEGRREPLECLVVESSSEHRWQLRESLDWRMEEGGVAPRLSRRLSASRSGPRRRSPIMLGTLGRPRLSASSPATDGRSPRQSGTRASVLRSSLAGNLSISLSQATEANQEATWRLYELSVTRFVLFIFFACAPTVGYIALSWPNRSRFRAGTRLCIASFCALVVLFGASRWLPDSRRQALTPVWPVACMWTHAVSVACITLALMDDFTQAQPWLGPAAAAQAYFWALHCALTNLTWIIAQMPPRLAFLPELLRGAAYFGATLWLAAEEPGALTRRLVIVTLTKATLNSLGTLLALNVLYEPHEAITVLLADVHMVPRPLRPAAAALERAGLFLREQVFGGVALLDATSSVVFCFYSCVMCYSHFLARPPLSLPDAASSLSQVLGVVLAANAAVKMRFSSAKSLDAAAAEATARAASVVFNHLRQALDSAESEASIIQEGVAALAELFPSALCVALGAFAGSTTALAALEIRLPCAGSQNVDTAAVRAGLSQSLHAAGGSRPTSVARTCRDSTARAALVLDSRDVEDGVAGCPDWELMRTAGLRVAASVTASVHAGMLTLGFATVHFDPASSRKARTAESDALHELSDIIGGAIFVRRALGINRELQGAGAGTFRRTSAVTPLSTALGQVNTVTLRLPSGTIPSLRDGVRTLSGDLLQAALSVDSLDAALLADVALLSSWDLDAWELRSTDLVRLYCSMLHSLGLFRRFSLAPPAVAAYVRLAAEHYQGNPFHNWRHAWSVSHAAWRLAYDSNVRNNLEDLDLLALLLAAMGHDLGHPGLTNAYQVNTGSELAIRYSDDSVLERHHAATCFALLDQSGALASLGAADLRSLRKTAIEAILYTDMGRHKELHSRVKARLEEHGGFRREAPEDRHLLTKFVLHCADLCNPLFAGAMSQRIAGELAREFEAQAALEVAAGLPVSVPTAEGAAAKAKMELGFLSFVVRPLYVTISELAPEIGGTCLTRIDANLAMWGKVAEEGASS